MYHSRKIWNYCRDGLTILSKQQNLKTSAFKKAKLQNKSYAGQKLYNFYKNLPLENCGTKEFFEHFTQNEKPGRSLLRKKIIKELVNFSSSQKQLFITVAVNRTNTHLKKK